MLFHVGNINLCFVSSYVLDKYVYCSYIPPITKVYCNEQGLSLFLPLCHLVGVLSQHIYLSVYCVLFIFLLKLLLPMCHCMILSNEIMC